MTVIYSTLESRLPLKFSSLRWMRAVVFRWRGWSHRLWSHSYAYTPRAHPLEIFVILKWAAADSFRIIQTGR